MIIQVDKMNIHYIERGSGDEIVLFLHGWGANVDTMIPAMKTIEEKYRTIAVDLPGFGQSDKPKSVWDAFDYGEFVVKFMDALSLSKVTLVGHSHGGRTSIVVGSKNKERVSKMVLIDSAGIPSKKSLKYHLKVFGFKCLKRIYKLMFFWKNSEETMETFYKKFGSDDYRNADGIMRKIMVAVLGNNLTDYLNEIECSTLLIWGENDDATPLYMGKLMESRIKDSGLVVLKDAGHFSYIDQYAQFDAVMKHFFEISR